MLGNNHKEWSDSRKIVSIQENGRNYRGNNRTEKKLCCYKVDGGVIQEGQRCDYALVNNGESKVYFIELKGTDISHAADQIRSTIEKLIGNLKGKVVLARIVCTHVGYPKIRRPALIKLEQMVAKLSGNVVIASMEYREDL